MSIREEERLPLYSESGLDHVDLLESNLEEYSRSLSREASDHLEVSESRRKISFREQDVKERINRAYRAVDDYSDGEEEKNEWLRVLSRIDRDRDTTSDS